MRAAVQEAAVLGHEMSSLAVKDFFNHRWELRLTVDSERGRDTERTACGGAGLTPPQESNG